MDRIESSTIYTAGFMDGVRELLDMIETNIEPDDRSAILQEIIREYRGKYGNSDEPNPWYDASVEKPPAS